LNSIGLPNQLRILIIDSDKGFCDIAGFYLSSQGITVVSAALTDETMEIVSDQLPEIILLSWDLSEHKALKILTEIKTDKRAKNIPVVVYASCLSKKIYDEAIANNAQDCIQKPEHPDGIQLFVESLLNKYMVGADC